MLDNFGHGRLFFEQMVRNDDKLKGRWNAEQFQTSGHTVFQCRDPLEQRQFKCNLEIKTVNFSAESSCRT